MRLNFPLKTEDLQRWRSATSHYQADLKSKGGWFPVGTNLFFHGGCHIDGNHPVHAIADGRLIAYRFTKQSIDPKNDSNLSFKTKVERSTGTTTETETVPRFPVSNNFVLTEHIFKPTEGKPFTFYFLCMNLCPLEELNDDQKEQAPLFFKNRFFVKDNQPNPDGDGLNLVEMEGGFEKTIVTVPKGSYLTEANDFDRSEAAMLGGKKRFSFTYFDENGDRQTVEGYCEHKTSSLDEEMRAVIDSLRGRSEAPSDCVLSKLHNTGNLNKFKVTTTKHRNLEKQGLNLHKQCLSSSEVIDIVPLGAELFFAEPGNVADENGNLIPVEQEYEKFKPITKYLYKGKEHPVAGYVKVDETTIEVNEFITIEYDTIQQPQNIRIQKEDVLGWSGNDGNMPADQKTVHLEIFIADDASFTAFKEFTDNYHDPETVDEDELIATQTVLDKNAIEQSLITSGNGQPSGCNVSSLIEKALERSFSETSIENMHKKEDASIYQCASRMTIKHKSEWFYQDGDFERLQEMDYYQPYCYLHQKVFAFWHRLNGFPNEVYFFHPIKFIEHIRLLTRIEAKQGTFYILKEGDTLWEIAQAAKINDWRRIYYDSGNDLIKEKRKNSSNAEGAEFWAGDEIWIPDISKDGIVKRPKSKAQISKTNSFSNFDEIDGLIEDPEDLGLTWDQMTRIGMLAVSDVAYAAATEVDYLRKLYQEMKIVRKEMHARMIKQGASEKHIARVLSEWRRRHAIWVREKGSDLFKKAAELFDKSRGNIERPNFESLMKKPVKLPDGGFRKRTFKDVIESSYRTNKRVNAFPKWLKWGGRSIIFVSSAWSLYVIVDAPEDKRNEIIEQELNLTIGGIAGGAAVTGLYIAFGLETGGLGFFLLVLAGGVAGSAGAEKMNLARLLDIAPHWESKYDGAIYYVEGDWDESDFFIFSVIHKKVKRHDGILVIGTGIISGEQIGGRGHYHRLEVLPLSKAAIDLFDTEDDSHHGWIPDYLLKPAEKEDLIRMYNQ